MRLVFMGSPDYAVPTLAALLDAGHQVARVYAQPPRPAGRGHKQRPCPVDAFARARGLEIATPLNFKDPRQAAALAALAPDVAVVVAYGLILPAAVLAAPRLGCLNAHASLLPRWRGAAPIPRAIEAGDTETGVCIMRMDAGLDTGPVLMRQTVPIGPAATAQGLHDALATLSARMMVDALARLDDLAAVPQTEAGATYAKKLRPGEGRLDFSQPAAVLERRIRAFNPQPGAWCQVAGKRLKVLEAQVAEDAAGKPGQVLDAALTVACGAAAMRFLRVQPEGKAAMPAADFLRGHTVGVGTVLE